MNALTPLETLFETKYEQDVPLPPELERFFGRFQFPPHTHQPHVIGNFVSTIDGVVALGKDSKTGGADISGSNIHDRALMGLLRALADAVVVGAGTLRADPRQLWTAEFIFPSLANAYQELRNMLGKSGPPLNVIITARGKVDLTLPVFQSGAVPVLIVTGPQGADHLRGQSLPPSVQIAEEQGSGAIRAQAVLEAIGRVRQSEVVLVEGGPHVMGDFFAEQLLDELFLTLAPHVAGRDEGGERLGLVEGRLFAPASPLWGTLTGVKRGDSHLFLRYAFPRNEPGGR